MTCITLSSDLGQNNAELAWLQSSFKERFSESIISDVYHEKNQFSLENIAYNVFNATKLFSDNSIHIVACKYSEQNNKVIILKVNQQYILCTDNGILSSINSMYSESSLYEYTIYELNFIDLISQLQSLTNQIKTGELEKLNTTQNIRPMRPFSTNLTITHENINSRIVFIDGLGNIVLNIEKERFQKHTESKNFSIEFFNNKITKISKSYSDVDQSSKIGAIFNSSGFLEIYMNGGNLASLYNFNKNSNNKVEIKLHDKAIGEINF